MRYWLFVLLTTAPFLTADALAQSAERNRCLAECRDPGGLASFCPGGLGGEAALSGKPRDPRDSFKEFEERQEKCANYKRERERARDVCILLVR